MRELASSVVVRVSRASRLLAGRLVAIGLASGAVFLLSHDHVFPEFESATLVHGVPPTHPWVLVNGKSWQIRSDGSEPPAVTDVAEGTRGACGPGMVEVRGAMKMDGTRGSVEGLQDLTCTRWITRDFPERCATFDRERWLAQSRELPTRPVHFCIDRYEYPNRKGAYPIIAVTWNEAKAWCEKDGERLCSEDEWTFACEGGEAMPYPNGYTRDEQACVIDRPWKLFDAQRFAVRDGPLAEAEVDYLWQGEASGSHPACRSVFGAHDMIGNVDEWTASVQHGGYRSVLKGGYWGPVRARCRASTRAHNEDFYFYQQGFRCCSDVPSPAGDGGTDAASD